MLNIIINFNIIITNTICMRLEYIYLCTLRCTTIVFTLYNVRTTYIVPRIVTSYIKYTVRCTLYIVHCTMFTVRRIVYDVHCTTYTVRRTVYVYTTYTYPVRRTVYVMPFEHYSFSIHWSVFICHYICYNS